MPSTPTIYSRVIAAKPELAVPGLVFERHFWTSHDVNGHMHDRVAEALILAHWLKAALDKSTGIGAGVAFLPGVNPLHALAEHFAPGSTKEDA